MNDTPITRRESIKKIAKLSAGIAAASGLSLSASSKNILAAETAPIAENVSKQSANEAWLIDGIGSTPGFSIRDLTRRMFAQAGGMKKFISKGDIVVIKPNISWAQPPHLAVTTNPEVMMAVIELCQEAGAKSVRIVDHTIHDARRCFGITGAGDVAKKTGADLVHPRQSLMRDMNLSGRRLDAWPVFVPIVEADKVINLPIAKVHGLSGLTLGMKNWIGAVGGRRNALHQDIHQSIVDLAQFFRPTLTLIDAVRVLAANGPSGGREEDVRVLNRLILSNDPVAVDARAALLFNKKPEDIGHIRLAHQQGLGHIDLNAVRQVQVTV
jgi:uncharacterized protein (DUF362 family)